MKNHHSYLARNPTEKILAKLGVPQPYWETELKSLPFRSVSFKGGKLSATAQRQWCKNIVVKTPFRSVMVASSEPTDAVALNFGCWVLRHEHKKHGSVRLINANELHDKSFYKSKDFWSKVYVIHNILKNATPERCEVIRDFLLRQDGCFRLLIISGEKNPEQWVLGRLGIKPVAAFFLRETLKK
jgi:hypothetical protein